MSTANSALNRLVPAKMLLLPNDRDLKAPLMARQSARWAGDRHRGCRDNRYAFSYPLCLGHALILRSR